MLATAVQQALAQSPSANDRRCIVFALPKGGLPIGVPIAQLLHRPLDIIVAKKITRPDNPELAIGAVTSDGHVIWAAPRKSSVPFLESPPDQNSEPYQKALKLAQDKAQQQFAQLVPSREASDVSGAIALVVDDGIATGMTIMAAVRSLRARQAAEVWVCVPVAPPELIPLLEALSDRVVVLATPTPFYSVSRFYRTFPQVSLEEAVECLHTYQTPHSSELKDL